MNKRKTHRKKTPITATAIAITILTTKTKIKLINEQRNGQNNHEHAQYTTYLVGSSMLAWSWYKEHKKITWELEQRKKKLENHKNLNNVLEKHEKNKLKETMHLKNEKIQKKNKNLKSLNGSKIISIFEKFNLVMIFN